jgi:hypothetical protein
MDLIDYFIVILLIFAINSIVSGWLYTEGQQKPLRASKVAIGQISYKNMLDLQFSKDNWPTVIYGALFTESNPFTGGYKLQSKVTAPQQTGIATQPVTSTTGMLRSG